jgi:hypothetical protein
MKDGYYDIYFKFSATTVANLIKPPCTPTFNHLYPRPTTIFQTNTKKTIKNMNCKPDLHNCQLQTTNICKFSW